MRAGNCGLGLTLLLTCAQIQADDSPCPEPVAVPLAVEDADPAPEDDRIHISAEEGEVHLEGTSRLSGNVELRQGDKRIVADHLEYDAPNDRFELDGAVRYTDPTLKLMPSGMRVPGFGEPSNVLNVTRRRSMGKPPFWSGRKNPCVARCSTRCWGVASLNAASVASAAASRRSTFSPEDR